MNKPPTTVGGICRRRLADVVVFDFGDGGEGDFHDAPVRAKHFDARRGQGLSAFHTAHRAPDSPPIGRDDFYVIFPV